MPSDPFFRLTVYDVFFIPGRDLVVTGQVEAGTLRLKDQVTLLKADGTRREVTVTGIEQPRKPLTEAQAGDNVGILLRGVQKQDVQRGDLLVGA